MPHCSAACDLIWHDMPDILFLLCIIRMIRSDTTHMNHIEVFQVFGVKTPFSSFHEVLALWQLSFLRMKIHGVSWSLCRDEGDPNLVLFSPVWFIPSSWNSAVEAWNFGGFSIDKGARFLLICLCCRGLENDPCSTKLRHSWISEWSLQCPGTFDEMWIDVIRFESFQRHCSALVVFVGWGIGDSFTSSFSKIQEATIIIHHVFWEPWLLIVANLLPLDKPAKSAHQLLMKFSKQCQAIILDPIPSTWSPCWVLACVRKTLHVRVAIQCSSISDIA